MLQVNPSSRSRVFLLPPQPLIAINDLNGPQTQSLDFLSDVEAITSHATERASERKKEEKKNANFETQQHHCHRISSFDTQRFRLKRSV